MRIKITEIEADARELRERATPLLRILRISCQDVFKVMSRLTMRRNQNQRRTSNV